MPETHVAPTTEAPLRFFEAPAGPDILPLPIPEVPIVRFVPEPVIIPEVAHSEYGIPEVVTTTTEAPIPFVEVPAGPGILPLPIPERPIEPVVRVAPYPARIEPVIPRIEPIVPIVREIPVEIPTGPYPAKIEPTTTTTSGPYPARVESHYH